MPPLCSSQPPRSPVRPASNRRFERPEIAEQRRGTGTPSVAQSCVAIVGCARFSRMNQISTTQSLPAACDPLAPGSYTVIVTIKRHIEGSAEKAYVYWPAMTAKPLAIKIKDDPQAVAAAEKALMARAERNEFARHVVRVYVIDPKVKACVDQFLNDDPKIDFKSLDALTEVRRFPAGSEARLQRLAMKHCRLKPRDENDFLLVDIAIIAGNIATDGAMEAASIIARSDADAEVRASAISCIGWFPQQRADAELLALLGNKDRLVHIAAVCELGARRNPAALKPLLKALKDEEWPTYPRSVAVRLLRGFRDNSAARDALTAALKDPDRMVRVTAKIALEAEAQDEDDD